MPSPVEILCGMNADRFSEVLGASPKSFREELFRRAGVKVKTDSFSVSSVSKNKLRTDRLHQAMGLGLDVKPEVWEEVIRNYLYTRRELLADALDHLQVEHDHGLTDHDLGFLDELPGERRQALWTFLSSRHDPRDVALYFAFMRIPDAAT